MITIKKLKKLNELFTFDGNNIFDYTTKNGNDYSFTDDNGTEYVVNLYKRSDGKGFNTLEIEYGIVKNAHQINIEPLKGKLDNNKLKIFNTVLNICKKEIDEFKPYIIEFSGDNDNGLANFYQMIIKSLKLHKDYTIKTINLSNSTMYRLVKNFEFIDLVNKIYYNEEGNIFQILYCYDGLEIFPNFHGSDYKIDLLKVIKFCVPDKQTITDSWTSDGDGWVKIFINKNIQITNKQIKEVATYIETLGLKFNGFDDNIITFYDPEKAK